MKKTRQRILDSARLLLNEHSYFKVTIRMIAEDLGMSSGNLNYHFKYREEILQALYFEMVEVFDRRVATLESQDLSFPFIRQSILESMERMVDYQFVWVDLHHILKEDKAIKKHFQAVYAQRKQGYLFLFKHLLDKKMLRVKSFEREYEMLANRMINYSNTWLNLQSLYQQKKKTIDCVFYADTLLAMLYPYLTKKGQTAFRAAAPQLFNT